MPKTKRKAKKRTVGNAPGGPPVRARQPGPRSLTPKVKGKGSYLTDAIDASPDILSTVGSAFGPIGRSAGNLVGNIFKKIVGRGAYKVQKNSLQPLYMGNELPAFGNITQGTRVVHREFLVNIVEPPNNNGAFTLINFRINPGLAASFPWLSNLAQNYQQYRIWGMIAEFRTNSSDVTISNSSIGLGTILMATDYDSVDANFVSKIQMMQSQYSTSLKPSLTNCHAFECARSATSEEILYTRSTNSPPNTDIRKYDLCNFQIATSGIPNSASAQTLGELWFSYDIELIKPELSGGIVGADDISWKWQGDIKTNSGTNMFGNNPILLPGSSPGAPTLSGNVITFPPNTTGNFYMSYYCNGTATTVSSSPSISANSSNISGQTIFNNSTFYGYNGPIGLPSALQWITFPFKILAVGVNSTITVGAFTSLSATSSIDFWITQYNPNIVN
jgi:hypothetical protein